MFGVVLPSRPVLGPAALQTVAANQFAFTFPAAPHFSHVVVFLLPDSALPADMLAGIYIQFPASKGSTAPPEFKLLGALSAAKQSAIFRVSASKNTPSGQIIGEVSELDMDPEADSQVTGLQGNVTVGISVEPAAALQPQLLALQQQQQLVLASKPSTTIAVSGSPVSTSVLAQRIAKNAFNFLSGFAGGDEKVPLKSFENWWKKFQSRVESDPGFLERDSD